MVNLSRSEFQNTSFALVAGGPYCPPQVWLARSGIASARRFATIKAPFPSRPRPSLHSTLYSILSPLSALPPVTGRAAQPPEFSPRDDVGLTWSACAILPPSRLTALIRPFLEPNFPQRWSDSDVGVDARPGQLGRSLPNPARGPLPSSLFFRLPF